jgi:hypothetical protein
MTNSTDHLTLADAVAMAEHARDRAASDASSSCCPADEARHAYRALMSEAVAIRELAMGGTFGADALDVIPVYGALMTEANEILDAELATWAVSE